MKKNKKILYYFLSLLMVVFTFVLGFFVGSNTNYQEKELNTYKPLLLTKKEAQDTRNVSIVYETTFDIPIFNFGNTTGYRVTKTFNDFVLFSDGTYELYIDTFVSNALNNNASSIGWTSVGPTTLLEGSFNFPFSQLASIEIYPELIKDNTSVSIDYVLQAFTTGELPQFQDYYRFFTLAEIELTDFFSVVTTYYPLADTYFVDGFNYLFKLGYNTRLNSVEDSEEKVNRIWGIFERAIQSVLNVLNMELLPGIPIYICVVVPVLFALLIWFIKLSQS